MQAMFNPSGIDCHILKDLVSSDVSRSNRQEKGSSWGPMPRGRPLLTILRVLFDGSFITPLM